MITVRLYLLQVEGIARNKIRIKKMNTLTQNNLIKAGGNLWEKGNASRVYLDNSSIEKAFDLKLSDTATYLGQFKSIGQSKVWFDCKNETLH